MADEEKSKAELIEELQLLRGRLLTRRDSSPVGSPSVEFYPESTAETTMRIDEEHLRDAQRIAGIGSFEGTVPVEELWWSAGLFDVFGLDESQFTPTKDAFSELLHPDDRDDYQAALFETLESGIPLKRKYRAKHGSGTWRHYETVARATRNGSGEIVGLRGTVQDITDREQAEIFLRESEAQLTGFFDASPAGLIMFDNQLRYTRVNESLAAINGLSAATHIGRTIREVLPELAPTIEPIIQRVIDTGVSSLGIELSGEVPREPGAERHWTASYFPILASDGSVSHVGGVIIDVTERERAERERATLEFQLRQS
jgi:PAS domain S-box-containing protein